MTFHDPYTHMEEAWELEANPFPPDAIRQPSQPFSPDVFPDEAQDFRRKLVRGAILANRGVGFLWSQGRRSDTGFGKTTLMMETAKDINRNLGATVLEAAGMRRERIMPVAAAYANLNNLDSSGLYSVLFGAVVDAATPPAREDDPPALLDTLLERIRADVGKQPRKVEDRLFAERMRTAPGAAPLRAEVVKAFASDGADGVLRQLSIVSPTARVRNGLQYLDFLITVCAAAGVDHLFVFVDQLEDLATNKSITAAKRSREIGRIRDLLEAQPYASRVHFVFTFHGQAASVLERFWEANRLPSFEATASNTASVVVLRGLQSDEQVAALLRVYLEDKRFGRVDDPLLPFEADALSVLRDVSEGRAGILLNRAHELLNAAAEQGLPKVDGAFARAYFDTDGAAAAMPGEDEEPPPADLDDVILG